MAEIRHQFEVDSISAAFELLMKTYLAENSSSESLQEYYFTITSKFDEEIKESSFSYYMKCSKSILIVFKSSVDDNEAYIFWRTSSLKSFKSLEISEDPNHYITDFCQSFLIDEMKKDRNGKKF